MLGEFEQVALLAILRVGRDAYGVPIRAEILDRTGRDVTLGAIYKTLGRLADKGLVVSRVGAPTAERGGRRTRCYSLTQAGRGALRETFHALTRLAAGLDLGLELR
ncbi:MAG: PadR family transcriptional regulator [Gemmatimonadales bacterium]|jgi:DNA-binding PadR family transcriptional regulator